MPNKPTTPFLLLHLPLLVLKEIFTSSTTYALFVYSTLSKRAKRIVKLACSQRKFKINFSPRPHINSHFLFFSDKYCERTHWSRLKLYVYSTEAQVPEGVINLNGNLIPACIKFEMVGYKNVCFVSSISTNWEDPKFGLRWMCQHLSDTFKIGFLELEYAGNDATVLIESAYFLRTMQPVNALYDNGWNIFTFEEVLNFMPTKYLSIDYPKMRYNQFIALFKMWKDGKVAEEITFYKCPNHMSIRPLARLVEGRPEVFVEYGRKSFEVKRDDERRWLVDTYYDVIKFRIIRL